MRKQFSNRFNRSHVYRLQRQRSLGPWLFACALFIAVLTITWQEVEGVGNPSRQQDTTIRVSRTAETTAGSEFHPPSSELPDVPANIPEPGTLILMGSGLTAGYLYLRKRLK